MLHRIGMSLHGSTERKLPRWYLPGVYCDIRKLQLVKKLLAIIFRLHMCLFTATEYNVRGLSEHCD